MIVKRLYWQNLSWVCFHSCAIADLKRYPATPISPKAILLVDCIERCYPLASELIEYVAKEDNSMAKDKGKDKDKKKKGKKKDKK